MKRFTLGCVLGYHSSGTCLCSDLGLFPTNRRWCLKAAASHGRRQSMSPIPRLRVLLRLPSASHSQLLPVRHLTFHS